MPVYFDTVPAIVFETIGVAGFALYVVNYCLLTLHRLTSHSTTFFAINLGASTCVLIGLTQSFNLASALIQTFWILISITAIVLRLRKRAGTSRQRDAWGRMA